jgi:hypothetical protein
VEKQMLNVCEQSVTEDDRQGSGWRSLRFCVSIVDGNVGESVNRCIYEMSVDEHFDKSNKIMLCEE